MWRWPSFFYSELLLGTPFWCALQSGEDVVLTGLLLVPTLDSSPLLSCSPSFPPEFIVFPTPQLSTIRSGFKFWQYHLLGVWHRVHHPSEPQCSLSLKWEQWKYQSHKVTMRTQWINTFRRQWLCVSHLALGLVQSQHSTPVSSCF